MIQMLCGTMKNLTIESGSFISEPDHSCGIFCEQVVNGALAEKLINKASITGDISTNNTFHQGTLFGICRGYIIDCENQGNVTLNLTQAKSKHFRYGGVIGSIAPADATAKVKVEGCKNTGNININCVSAIANVYLGGITGVCDSKGSEFSFKNCSNSGKLSLSNPENFSGTAYVGGLAGQRNEGAISDCTSSGEIDVAAFNVDKVYTGGLVGYQKNGYSGECFQGCKVNANVKAAFLKEGSTTANPLANAAMVIGNAGDAGVTFGSAESPIVISGSLYSGTTEIKVTSANVQELAIGANSAAVPTFNLSVKTSLGIKERP